MKKYNTILLILFSLFILSCDEGLAPLNKDQSASLNINIKFINDWPKKDSVFGLRVAAFKLPPSESLLGEITSGNANISDLITDYDINSKNIEFIYSKLPLDLKYIVVAWQYESDITMQRIVGVYNNSIKTEPAMISLDFGDRKNIEIEVDWNDFPPQPF